MQQGLTRSRTSRPSLVSSLSRMLLQWWTPASGTWKDHSCSPEELDPACLCVVPFPANCECCPKRLQVAPTAITISGKNILGLGFPTQLHAGHQSRLEPIIAYIAVNTHAGAIEMHRHSSIGQRASHCYRFACPKRALPGSQKIDPSRIEAPVTTSQPPCPPTRPILPAESAPCHPSELLASNNRPKRFQHSGRPLGFQHNSLSANQHFCLQ